MRSSAGIFASGRGEWILHNSFASGVGTGSRSVNPSSYGSVGDTIVVYVIGLGNTGWNGNGLTPPNWTPIIADRLDGSGGDSAWSCAVKQIESTDNAAVNFISSGATYDTMILVFRGPTPSLSQIAAQRTSGNPSAQPKVVASESVPLIIVAACGSGAFSVFSPAATGDIGTTRGRLAYALYNNNPLDTNIDEDDSGDRNMLCSCVIKGS